MHMSPNCALLGIDVRLFGASSVSSDLSFSPEQLIAPTSSVVALVHYGMHVDRHFFLAMLLLLDGCWMLDILTGELGLFSLL